MNHRTLPALLRRLVAAGCAALVMALTVFAASPLAHATLHGDAHHGHAHHHDEDAGEGDACAVELFAGGVALALGLVALAPPHRLAGDTSRVADAEIFLVSPRYLHQPERGPPGLGIA